MSTYCKICLLVGDCEDWWDLMNQNLWPNKVCNTLITLHKSRAWKTWPCRYLQCTDWHIYFCMFLPRNGDCHLVYCFCLSMILSVRILERAFTSFENISWFFFLIYNVFLPICLFLSLPVDARKNSVISCSKVWSVDESPAYK